MLTAETGTTPTTFPEERASEVLKLLPPEPGQVVDGRFLILEFLKEGGTSRILKATDLEYGDLVALKVPKEHFAQDAEFLERFQREEEIGLQVRHPYLLSMRLAPRKSRPYLVMEYAKGDTLATRLASGPRPSVPEAVRILDMILRGLGELHRLGIVHRDVTPQNVMLCPDGTVRLMDYGIAARGKPRDRATSEEWTWGTPAYMAPEQVQNFHGDARTDLYSTGIILFEMLTGTVPFTGDDPVEVMNARLIEAPVFPRTLNPDLDPDLERVILRALEREPQDRFRDAPSMLAALEPFLRDWIEWPTRWRLLPVLGGWLREHWPEVATTIVLASLAARTCHDMKFLSP